MNNIKPKELSKLGYTNDKARSLALNILSKHYKHSSKDDAIKLLASIRESPGQFAADELLGKIAATFMNGTNDEHFEAFDLRTNYQPAKVYGGKGIESSAKQQMETVMSLPVALQGALMPDAHAGFGMPIGGVLATNNAVIPYAVGMDIGCRMALTIIDEGENFLRSRGYDVKTALKEHTHFGMEGGLETRQHHEILDDNRFQDTELLKRLHGKAVRQLGTSGSGNHFVEFGTIDMDEGNALGLPPRRYLALLSHSGSRGLGSGIAQHYTRIAMDRCRLPRHAKQLAWLDLDTAEGQEYWLSMNLAGDYARACHGRIHANLLKSLGLEAIVKVENHHNFAWKEALADGTDAVIHRKGATPAHKDELGIIPGSMTTAAYLVMGLGEPLSLCSASHGAGRAMSRQRAKESMTVSGMKQMLSSAGVTLIGGSVEENPLAYKDINHVMAAQQSLVAVQGRFMPRVVRMNKE